MEFRDRPSEYQRNIDGYGDESVNIYNYTDKIHDGRHASQLPTTQFLATISNLGSPEPERCRFPPRVIGAGQQQTGYLLKTGC